jgi:acyl-CoA thioester hydrolase
MIWRLFTEYLQVLMKNSGSYTLTRSGADMVETYRGVVYPWQCDHMGHMNVQYYAAKFDEATWQLFGAVSMTPEYLRSANRGMVAVQQKTKYKAEVVAGDIIEIKSCILEIKCKSIRFYHVMIKSHSNEAVAETEFVGVHIDTISRKSCEFEEQVVQAASNLIHSDAACGVD